MSVDVATGTHMPKNSMLFEFDDEVIAVFDNMSRRSIVGYDHAYRMIGHFASRYQWPAGGCQVWDFGTTIGKALLTIREGAHLRPYIDYCGVDISEASVNKTKAALPWATVIQHDLRESLFPKDNLPTMPVHMMVFGYTLQFIEDHAIRTRLIQEAFDWLEPGGMLFVLEKYKLANPFLNEVAQDAYIQFRRDNGYTLTEITTKSQALSNAMWPASPQFMERAMTDAGFTDIQVLYRDLNFGGLVAIK